MPNQTPAREPTSPLLVTVRYVLPIAVVVAGLIFFLTDPTVRNFEGPAALIGAGLSVLLLNVLHRAGVRGDVDRDREAAARSYFDAHGHWPDEARQAGGMSK
ncbi:hypothetical protein Q5424_12880 [Conexibacter sp. JD483]|uniref:hypothetical protein n=1 Tax=unclassified Conexibacter TaxID=2627773 RepID=UPI00271AA6C2|nr:MULTISPECIES: hypothetical protein [unclassified Conexibacter]MDO8187323.1 hypothetical protein [Conexibacter sp. CPCC 205706]MDO8200544.1 hypothetical protein [Conexibacter sp. CPCC 205762]MDR9369987.1 hypothetical protein [Conexibacter sp. JD483]